MTATAQSVSYFVDLARLQWGKWCHETGREIGRGDIHASYSADRIGMEQPIRKPFEWKGGLWVCTSFSSTAEAYRLTPPQAFGGQLTTYRDKISDGGETARKDPNGFYNGMIVKHGGRTLVLSGPPAVFAAGEPEQMDLFGGSL